MSIPATRDGLLVAMAYDPVARQGGEEAARGRQAPSATPPPGSGARPVMIPSTRARRSCAPDPAGEPRIVRPGYSLRS